ncbi:MAG: hypothetical protein WA979_13455, partial [Pacificimonas sp.]
ANMKKAAMTTIEADNRRNSKMLLMEVAARMCCPLLPECPYAGGKLNKEVTHWPRAVNRLACAAS